MASRAPMNENAGLRVREHTEAIYRAESRRVFATLIRLLGDFDLAEEALHDAFRAALEQWPRDGVPANPRAWLVSAGRFKAIDGLRRNARFDSMEDRIEQVESIADDAAPRRRRHRGRSAAPHLHLLSPGIGARRPGGADVARGLRSHHRRDRAGVPEHAPNPCATHRAGKANLRARIPTRCRSPTSCHARLDSVLRVSTSSSTKGIRHRPAHR